MPDRDALVEAGVLLFTLTADLTKAAVESLGAGNGGNRQVQILLALHARPGQTPSGLAESLGMSRSSMSHALARFEADDLIDRSVDRTDRRSLHLGLSSNGTARLRAFGTALGRVLASHAGELRRGAGLLGFPAAADSCSHLSVLEAGERLGRAGSAYVDDISAAMGPLGPLEGRERFVMALIHRHGALRPAALSAFLRMSSSGTSTLLDRLESLGLVHRTHGTEAGDRRAVLVRFTPKGAKAADASLDVLERHAAELAGAMTSALIPMRSDGVA
ncbi:MAG TPA: MarR family transcriptional regulator [Propionicimonas sp.]|jgi:DNA-binding MarR family transcriptional regulator|uniref:MarR family transcriptional regulator n=1 Tax=Propionicimonas sp. TaxID=1955623 RepID=UPI002F3E2A85